MNLEAPLTYRERLEQNIARFHSMRLFCIRIYREYPYHVYAYSFLALRYLLPALTEMFCYFCYFFLFHHHSVSGIIGLISFAITICIWKKWIVISNWIYAQRIEDLDFPTLHVDIDEEELGKATKEEKHPTGNSLPGVQGDNTTTPPIDFHTSGTNDNQRRRTPDHIVSAPSLGSHEEAEGQHRPEMMSRSLEHCASPKCSGLSTDLFPEIESDICLVKEEEKESLLQILDQEPISDSQQKWATFNSQTTIFIQNSTEAEPNLSASLPAVTFQDDFADNLVTYIHYKSPSPDSDSSSSHPVDQCHYVSGLSSPNALSFASENEDLVKIAGELLSLMPDVNGDSNDLDDKNFMDPEMKFIPPEAEVCKATPSYSCTQRSEFLVRLQTIFDTAIKESSESPVIKLTPVMQQTWMGSFRVKKSFRWRKCNVLLSNNHLDITLLFRKKGQDQWELSLNDIVIDKSPGVFGCRRGHNRRIKLSSPCVHLMLKAKNCSVKKQFLSKIEDSLLQYKIIV